MTILAPPTARQAAWPARPKLRIRRSQPGDDSSPRPLTATLDHPLVLNAELLSKLDMTVFTKQGLLAISRLCTVPLLSRPIKKRRRPQVKSMDEEDSSASEVIQKPKKELKEAKKGKRLIGARSNAMDMVMPKALAPPEPCRTCGRPEQPERLHSHPVEPPTTVRTPVKAPTPQRPSTFKSAGKLRREKEKPEEKPVAVEAERPSTGRPRSGRPRLVTCYICSREFGTASYPLHEPKCIQKWERENAQLPPALRRKLPEKPSGSHVQSDWNESAWQASQAALVPCPRCGRTFYPDRLAVHVKSCKVGGSGTGAVSPVPPTPPSPSNMRPPTVPCYICGREFGTRSIAIHEPQCLKKWKMENAALPQALQRPDPKKPEIDMSKVTGCYICGAQMSPKERVDHETDCLQEWRDTNNARPEGQRLPEPIRPDYRFTGNGGVDCMGTWHAIWENHKDSLVPCRQCGRRFFPDRIERHEAVCRNTPVGLKKTPH